MIPAKSSVFIISLCPLRTAFDVDSSSLPHVSNGSPARVLKLQLQAAIKCLLNSPNLWRQWNFSTVSIKCKSTSHLMAGKRLYCLFWFMCCCLVYSLARFWPSFCGFLLTAMPANYLHVCGFLCDVISHRTAADTIKIWNKSIRLSDKLD